MNTALAKAFVTPIDREGLDMLSHQMDDVTDNLSPPQYSAAEKSDPK